MSWTVRAWTAPLMEVDVEDEGQSTVQALYISIRTPAASIGNSFTWTERERSAALFDLMAARCANARESVLERIYETQTDVPDDLPARIDAAMARVLA